MFTFYGDIANGELKIKNKDKVLRDIKTLKDGFVIIEMKYAKQRSTKQNKYYWGIIVFLIRKRLEELGNVFNDTETHEFLKDKFNSKMVIGEGGEMIGEFGQSTSVLTKEQFSDYIEKIISWSNDFLGLEIPFPNSKLSLW